jgi:hypothetical protein
MIRKLLLPALLVGLLGGCVTAGYGYRDGYYYGQPSVEYRYYDYGYPYYPGYSYYGYPYYGYPYYRRPYYYPYYYHRRPRPPGTPSTGDNHDNPPPWRDLNRRRRVEGPDGLAPDQLGAQGTPPPWRDPNRRGRVEGPGGLAPDQLGGQGTPPPDASSRQRTPRREVGNDGSRMQQVMRRAQDSKRRAEAQEP